MADVCRVVILKGLFIGICKSLWRGCGGTCQDLDCTTGGAYFKRVLHLKLRKSRKGFVDNNDKGAI